MYLPAKMLVRIGLIKLHQQNAYGSFKLEEIGVTSRIYGHKKKLNKQRTILAISKKTQNPEHLY